VRLLARRGLTGLVAGLLVATGTAQLAGAHETSRLDQLRIATAPYFDLDQAVEDGYGELQDADGIACIASDDPAAGAMGIHFVNSTFVGDSRIHLLKPEALIYEPQADGDMELIAVEYVVFRSAWRAEHPTGRPKRLGQTFELVKAGNRYGLPPFYELHVWAWRHNPNGLFADYNPDVSCEFAPAT
jgi:hypothetical protein